MFLLPIITIGLLAWALVSLGFVPSPLCRTLIRVRRGEIRLERGDLNPRAKEHLADVVREIRLEEGFISISQSRAVTFSRKVPETVRQRLRNILLN